MQPPVVLPLTQTTLDAMVMEGGSLGVGAVSNLRHVKHAAATARLVLEHTRHSMLAGLQAAQFAQDMGMPIEDLSTEASIALHKKWLKAHCQPNFRRDVVPDPAASCGPYSPADAVRQEEEQALGGSDGSTKAAAGALEEGGAAAGAAPLQLGAGEAGGWPTLRSHDTIAMAAIDKAGNIAAACSTNGAIHKVWTGVWLYFVPRLVGFFLFLMQNCAAVGLQVPGRVGDASIPGGGAYADSEVGACGATGDGDVHIRFLPCYQVGVWAGSAQTPCRHVSSCCWEAQTYAGCNKPCNSST